MARSTWTTHTSSPQTCTLHGDATIVLLDGARRPLPTVLHWGSCGFFTVTRPARLVTLVPGGNAYVALSWVHIPTPGQRCPLSPTLVVLPPAAASARSPPSSPCLSLSDV